MFLVLSVLHELYDDGRERLEVRDGGYVVAVLRVLLDASYELVERCDPEVEHLRFQWLLQGVKDTSA